MKRFIDYETIGELFRQVNRDSHELTISERIWQAILELAATINKVFSIADEDGLDALVNESDELAHICELYQCKMASEELPKFKFSIFNIESCHIKLTHVIIGVAQKGIPIVFTNYHVFTTF